MYRTTIESQRTVRNNSLRGDYQHREEAFLRALIANTPNVTIATMQDNSWPNSALRFSLRWDPIIIKSLLQSNASVAASDTDLATLGLTPANLRKGHTADNANGTLIPTNVVLRSSSPNFGSSNGSGSFTTGVSSVGSPLAVNPEYPVPLYSPLNAIRNRTRNYPTICHRFEYNTDVDGWVGADTTAYPQFNILPSPSSHFSYKSSNTLVAKHNWWAFELDFAREDRNLTALAGNAKEYIYSLYEIPSQLALSSNSSANFGAFSDGTPWGAQVNLQGAVFAETLATTGDFAVDAVSSRKGAAISAGTTFNNSTITGAAVGSNPMQSEQRELAESNDQTFPISSSSDGGKVAFIPINRDISFYDRFAGRLSLADADSIQEQQINVGISVTTTRWAYYSNGAHQCAINLDIIGVISDTDQTATTIQLRYFRNGAKQSTTYSTVGVAGSVVWPDSTSASGLDFPFHNEISSNGTPRLAVYMDRLAPFLTTLNADTPDINHSISVNADYTDVFIRDPATDYDTTNSIVLKNAEDFTDYTKGFSLVTNMRLILPGSVNTTPLSDANLPEGINPVAGEPFYPPTSIFSPQKRFGDRSTASNITINGQIGSIGQDSSTFANPLDLKSGTNAILDPDRIAANLTSIDHPGELPPINMMNWMITIREKK